MRALSLFLLAAITLRAQSFEVASVKEHTGPMPRIGVTTKDNRLIGDACGVKMLVMFAFDVKPYQIVGGGPDMFFDVEAKGEGEAIPSRDQFRAMLRALLADRFKLRTHSEQREMPVYALMVGKKGPKFKEAAPGAEAVWRLGVDGRNYQLTLEKYGMPELAEALNNTGFVDRPVVDRTGLTGNYSIRLTYTRANLNDDPANIDIFAAVQSQLGLTLQRERATVPVVVIEHWEPPERN